MRNKLTYRQKRQIRKILKWVGILLAVLIVSVILFIIFVERYVVYTKDGVYIDYDQSAAQLQATDATEPAPSTPLDVNIRYETPLPSPDDGTLIHGYSLSARDLQDAESLIDWAGELERGSIVLMELKAPDGLLYYSSNLADVTRADINTTAVDQLIVALRKNGCVPVAQLSAFADDNYAMNHPEAALVTEDNNFWIGGHNAYWVNPSDEGVATYLQQIAGELINHGFSEIVFADYIFPENESIVLESETSRWGQLIASVNKMIDHFADTSVAVSFLISEPDFPAECLSGRLYVRNTDATMMDKFVSTYDSDRWEAAKNMIFVTTSRDSRFNDYGTLVPYTR